MSDSLTVTVIQCGGKGCNNTFTTSEPVSSEFTYACKLHPKRKQKNIPVFQEVAHDKALDGKEKQEDFKGQGTRRDENEKSLSGEPLNSKYKCPHGVYAPNENTRYCSVCNPVVVTGSLLHMKKLKVDLGDKSKYKVGIFRNPEEQIDQSIGALAFYQNLEKKPEWLREVHFPKLSFSDLNKVGFVNQNRTLLDASLFEDTDA